MKPATKPGTWVKAPHTTTVQTSPLTTGAGATTKTTSNSFQNFEYLITKGADSAKNTTLRTRLEDPEFDPTIVGVPHPQWIKSVTLLEGSKNGHTIRPPTSKENPFKTETLCKQYGYSTDFASRQGFLVKDSFLQDMKNQKAFQRHRFTFKDDS